MRIATAATAAVIASLTGSPALSCDFHFTCGDLNLCLHYGVDNDIRRIRDGARPGNGHVAWEGGDACWTNFDKTTNQWKYGTWHRHTTGCSDEVFQLAAKAAIENRCPVTGRTRPARVH